MFYIFNSDVGIGTNDESDVFPERQVGYNSSGSVTIAGDDVHLGNDTGERGNLTDALDKSSSRKKRSASQLYMEPGRYVGEYYAYKFDNLIMCFIINTFTHDCAGIKIHGLSPC